MKIVVDRIEGDFAVCELPNSKIVNIPLSILENVKEGEVYKIEKDDEEKKERKAKAQSLFVKLIEKDSE